MTRWYRLASYFSGSFRLRLADRDYGCARGWGSTGRSIITVPMVCIIVADARRARYRCITRRFWRMPTPDACSLLTTQPDLAAGFDGEDDAVVGGE